MASPVPSENLTRSEGRFISATNENDARMACIARLETFTKCPADKFIHAKPADLAAAGFEYILGVDLFRCSSCGVEIRDWKEGEEPLEVHRNRSRNCRFLQENFMNSASYSDAVASVGGASLLTDSEEASSATAGGNVWFMTHAFKRHAISLVHEGQLLVFIARMQSWAKYLSIITFISIEILSQQMIIQQCSCWCGV